MADPQQPNSQNPQSQQSQPQNQRSSKHNRNARPQGQQGNQPREERSRDQRGKNQSQPNQQRRDERPHGEDIRNEKPREPRPQNEQQRQQHGRPQTHDYKRDQQQRRERHQGAPQLQGSSGGQRQHEQPRQEEPRHEQRRSDRPQQRDQRPANVNPQSEPRYERQDQRREQRSEPQSQHSIVRSYRNDGDDQNEDADESFSHDNFIPPAPPPARKVPPAPEFNFPPVVSPKNPEYNALPSSEKSLYTGARGAAIRVLSRVEQSDSYLDKVLENELAGSDLNALDRALLTELVHGVMRWQSKLDWVLTGFYHGEFVKCITPVKNAMRIALYQVMFLSKIPPFAAVNESVELIKRLKGARSANLVNAILRNILHNITNIRYPHREEDAHRYMSIMYSHPFWMVKRWAARYGDEATESLLKANNERPKIMLRINTLQGNRQELMEFLDGQQIKHWDSLYEERLLLVGSLASVREWEPYQRGWFSVQDASAALVVKLANPQAGQTVIDLCAAPGGKTTFCAELMQDKGKVIAVDKYTGKLNVIQENMKRLQLTCIEMVSGDARSYKAKERADIVLVDAPCSGLGTLAKKPDIRWKLEIEQISPLVRLQREILANAATLVKPGGTLVYSTCTIEPEENTQQAAWFLEQFPEFTLDAAEQYLPAEVCKDGLMQTFPHVHQTDGAFGARFVRKK